MAPPSHGLVSRHSRSCRSLAVADVSATGIRQITVNVSSGSRTGIAQHVDCYRSSRLRWGERKRPTGGGIVAACSSRAIGRGVRHCTGVEIGTLSVTMNL